jgi:hypothetical protein
MWPDLGYWWPALLASALGAYAVGWWAFCDFHAPHGIGEIAFAVRRPRYWLALSSYLCGILIVYFLLVFVGYFLISTGYPARLEVPGVALSAALAAVLVPVLLPLLP